MSAIVDFTGQATLFSGSTAPTSHTHDVGEGYSGDENRRVFIKKNRVDTANTGVTNAIADVYQAIFIPANTLVIAAWFKVIEAEVGTDKAIATFALNGPSTDEWVAAAVCTALTTHATNGSTNMARTGYLFTADDTIDLLCAGGEFENAIIEVYAVCVDMN